MKKKIIAGILFMGVIIAFGVSYLFHIPHRDVQASKTDFNLSSTELVNEYLRNPHLADEKYLQEEGDSKILAVTGTVFSISQDLNSQKVVLLKDSTDKAGVSCTFTLKTNKNLEKLKVGQTVSVKGVIRSGAGFDKDMGLYENVILEKCNIILP